MARTGQGKNESVPLYHNGSHTVNEPTARHLHKRTYSTATQKQLQPRVYEEKSDKAKDDDYDTLLCHPQWSLCEGRAHQTEQV